MSKLVLALSILAGGLQAHGAVTVEKKAVHNVALSMAEEKASACPFANKGTRNDKRGQLSYNQKNVNKTSTARK